MQLTKDDVIDDGHAAHLALVLRQVQALLDQGRAIGSKPLSEYNKVRGYADAAQWVYGQALEP